LVSLIFSTPIAAYSQFAFVVPSHQQQQFPISQVVSLTKDKPKTTGVKGTEHRGTVRSSKCSHLSSITTLSLLPAGISSTTNGISSNGSNNKIVIINFDDSFKNQFLYAKPILDKYGFKATFFEVCG
jgi:hypothetical protein